MIKNNPYDVNIHCVWCLEEWVLPKNEIWYNPYICLKCKKEMGIPLITHGSKNIKGEMVEFHEARDYRFSIQIPKTKVIKFIEKLDQEKGSVLNVYPREFGGWILTIIMEKAFEFENIKFQNPPILMGQ